jgi:hypothetical protein
LGSFFKRRFEIDESSARAARLIYECFNRKRRSRPSENALPYLNPVPITAIRKAIPESLSRPLSKSSQKPLPKRNANDAQLGCTGLIRT